MIRVVLDTNVFISALIKPGSTPAKILELAKRKKIELLSSMEILDEIRRVLIYPRIAKLHKLTAEELKLLVESYAAFAIITPGKTKVTVIKADPSDNKFLACALEGKADFIISGDRHLKELKQYKGIPILEPAEFLKRYEKAERIS